MSLENAISEMTAAVKANTAVLEQLVALKTATPAAEPAAAPAKPGRKTGATAAAAAAAVVETAKPAAEPTPPPAAAQAPAPAAAEPAKEPATADDDGLGDDAPTLDDVRKSILLVRDRAGKPAAKEILTKLSAAAIDAIPAAKFEEALALCQAALDALKK